MEYVQERVTTLHDLAGRVPDAPTDRAAVVLPMTERECSSVAAEHTLSALEAVEPGRVVVALRAPRSTVGRVREWLASFDLPAEVLWCNAPGVTALLEEHGLTVPDAEAGKGRDVWLALGVAASEAEYVAVHDADATTYSAADVPRLLAPLADGFSFAKGYYARVENDRLYGRLCRLFYAPLVRALADRHDAAVLDYLGAFRYALAGECAMDADLATRIRLQRRWGLEVGMLGEAFDHCGFEGSAQVDLGSYEHDHRSVSGPSGLTAMSAQVGEALFQVAEANGVRPDYAALPERYEEAATRYVAQYAADARFNDLDYDPADEREQVARYARTIAPPGPDSRLPAWTATDLSADAVLAASRDDVAAASDLARQL